MVIKISLVSSVALILCGVGCTSTDSQPKVQGILSPVAEFRHYLADHGSISFRSNDGRAFRADADTELTFYANGDACMLEYGMAGQGFQGNFRIYPDGCLISWFKNYPTEWAAMCLTGDRTRLLLRPLNPPNGLMPMEPGASTQPAKLGYWQFRMLVGDDEKQVLKTIQEWGAYRPPR